MADIVILIIILCVLAIPIWYVRKEKKAGSKCIGCPYSKTCNSKEQCDLK